MFRRYMPPLLRLPSRTVGRPNISGVGENCTCLYCGIMSDSQAGFQFTARTLLCAITLFAIGTALLAACVRTNTYTSPRLAAARGITGLGVAAGGVGMLRQNAIAWTIAGMAISALLFFAVLLT